MDLVVIATSRLRALPKNPCLNHEAGVLPSEILLFALLVAPITFTANASAYQVVADGGGGDVRATTSYSSALETIRTVAQSINAAGAGQLAVVASLTFNAIRSVGIVGTVVLVLGF